MKPSMLFKCSTYLLASQLCYAPVQARAYIEIHDNLESIAAQIESLCPTLPPDHQSPPACHACPLGNALFRAFAPDQWYAIRVPIVPDTALLSRKRTAGFVQGDLNLEPNGVTILREGTYSVNFSVILQNPDKENNLILPVFLALNGEVDPAGIENVAILRAGSVVSVSASGILRNVSPCTQLTIRIGNSPNAADDCTRLNVISWDINLFEIPCDAPELSQMP